MSDNTNIDDMKRDIYEFYSEIFGAWNEETESREGGLKAEIGNTKEEIEAYKIEVSNHCQEVNEVVNTIFDDSNEESLINKKELIYQNINEISEKIEKSTLKQEEIDRYYSKIFGVWSEETDSREGGLKAEIEKFRRDLDEYNASQREIIAKIKQQANDALNGAVNVGLAQAFKEQVNKFTKSIKSWNVTFVLSIMYLIGFSIVKFFCGTGADFSTIKNTLNFFFSGIPFTAPLVWLAIYCGKRRSEYSMLLQEYTHKAAFASSYNSYKKQIEELQEVDTELSKELLEKAIHIIAKNPTSVLEKEHSADLPIKEVSKLIKAILYKGGDVKDIPTILQGIENVLQNNSKKR